MEADWGKANLKAREKGLVRKEMDLPKRMERVKLKGKAGKNKLQGRKDFRTSSALQARTLHRKYSCRMRHPRCKRNPDCWRDKAQLAGTGRRDN